MRFAWVLVVLAACGDNHHSRHDTLVRVDGEPAGVNCANGGVAINTGSDTNDDGLLEDGEITGTQYVCNAAAPVQCAAGTSSIPGPITITTPGDFAQLAGVACINGDLLITNLASSSFEPLPDLQTVTGTVVIAGNRDLVSLDGLTLQQVGTSYIVQANGTLADLTSLGALRKSGPIQIVANDSLVDLSGLAPLSQITGLVVSGNASLESVHGLENATKIDQLTLHENPKLTSLDALAQLRECLSVDVSGNSVLPLISLPALQKIGRGMTINENPALTMVDLPVLATTGGMQFYGDAAMTTVSMPEVLLTGGLALQVDTSLTTFSAPKLNFATDGVYIIQDPMLVSPDLGSLSAVGTILWIDMTGFVDFTGFGSLRYVSGDVRITNNSSLTGFSGLSAMQQIGGNLLIGSNSSLATSTADAFAAQVSVGGTTTIN